MSITLCISVYSLVYVVNVVRLLAGTASAGIAVSSAHDQACTDCSELPLPGEDWVVPPVPMTDEQKFFFVRAHKNTSGLRL